MMWVIEVIHGKQKYTFTATSREKLRIISEGWHKYADSVGITRVS